MNINKELNPSKQRVEALKALGRDEFELWRFYEDRADRLGARMWSIGIWLMAVVAATVSTPFAAKFLEPTKEFPYIVATAPIATALLAVFGILFCIYSYAALRDLREHIESNWRKAGYILEGTWEFEWGGRKSHGWNVLFWVGTMALLAFLELLLLALVSALS